MKNVVIVKEHVEMALTGEKGKRPLPLRPFRNFTFEPYTIFVIMANIQ